MPAYPDTSFLVSLYAPDMNSETAAVALAKADLPFLLTPFQELELINALWLRVFRKEIRPKEVKAAIAAFREDIVDGVYFLKPFTSAVFDRGLRLAQKHTKRNGVRTLDLLHISSALEFRAHEFYTFDQRQLKLAARLGLGVAP